MWKVLEVFKASDIFQRLSPVQEVDDQSGLVTMRTRTAIDSNGGTKKYQRPQPLRCKCVWSKESTTILTGIYQNGERGGESKRAYSSSCMQRKSVCALLQASS